MDELLSLFGADDGSPPAADQETKSGSGSGPNDDFASSFAEAFALVGDAGGTGGCGGNRTGAARQSTPHLPSQTSHPAKMKAASISKNRISNNNNNNTSCDPFTGLRIVNRRTSRADMVDAFSSFTYKSCSALAAASRAEWSGNYLVDGGSNSNGGGPSGKTNIATCGVLTSDTSSRLSAKTGRAFAILSLGDMPSSMHAVGGGSNALSHHSAHNSVSASITVFLFGDALGALRSNKKYMNPGWAVAILGPNLMPPRTDDKANNGATSITLSVNDPRQILPIGKVVDCDRCRGTMRMRVRSDSGRSSWEDVRCSTLVDLRLGGGYCMTHRRQGLSSGGGEGGKSRSGSSNRNSNNNLTFMQKQRMQHMPSNGGNGIHVKTGNGLAFGRAPSSSLLGTGSRAAPSSLSQALSQSGLFEPAPALAPAAQKTQFLKRAPLHMKKMPSSAARNSDNVTTLANAKAAKTTNPYKRDVAGQKSQSTKRKEPRDLLGEALERKRLRTGHSLQTNNKSTQAKRPCKVFTTEGFDGSVEVPKPSAILFQRKAPSTMAITPSPNTGRNGLSMESANAILERQKNMASLFRKENGAIVSASASKKKSTLNKEALLRSKQKIVTNRGTKLAQAPSSRSETSCQLNKASNFASAFGQASIDREAIFNAKSKFASDADAQEYARARSVVQELECREESKNASGKKKNETSKQSITTTGWACRTCQKSTPYKPVSCIRARHDVRQKRELKAGAKSLGSRGERLGRHDKDPEQGGLTLGSGLEWSGWRGGLG